MLLRSALLAAALAVSGCALFRPPLTPSERLVRDAARLAEAPSDSARASVALDLISQAGLTPVAGRRFEYGSVVGGFIPGRTPLSRDTLVIAAAALDGQAAAALIAAGARLADAAARRGADPGRTVLVALWASGRTADEGLADVLSFPLWPKGAVQTVLVVGAPPTDARLGAEPVSLARGAPDEVADALVRRLVDAATAPLFLVPPDSLLTP